MKHTVKKNDALCLVSYHNLLWTAYAYYRYWKRDDNSTGSHPFA